MKHILILGTGFGGIQTYLSLRKRWTKSEPFHITLLNKENYFLYMPMLHEVTFGAVEPSHILHPIREFIRRSQNYDTFFQDEVTQIIPEENRVLTKKGKELGFDVLLIALGGIQAYGNVPGAKRYTFPLKSMRDGITLRNQIVEIFETYEGGELYFTIVGGGATGVETAGQMAELFQKTLTPLYPHIDFSKVHITLIHNHSRLVPHLKGGLSIQILKKLSQMKVKILLEKKITQIKEGEIEFDNGSKIPTHLTVWSTGIASPASFFMLPQYLNERGFIQIEKNLLLKGFKNIFAIGDIAELDEVRIPKTAQAAVAQGKHVAKNIRRLLKKRNPLPFTYHHKGDLIPLGNWFAVGQIGGFIFSGRFVWVLRRIIFLFHLYQPADKIRVMLDWIMNVFSRRDTSKIE